MLEGTGTLQVVAVVGSRHLVSSYGDDDGNNGVVMESLFLTIW